MDVEMHTDALSEYEVELINMLRPQDPNRNFEIVIRYSDQRFHVELTKFEPDTGAHLEHIVADHPTFDGAWFDMTPPELREITPAENIVTAGIRPKLRIVRNGES